ncbi:MAG: hypothetical protein H0X30_29580 [Anaerolineae bacterium]|nr:hypothetical protein [Anaerolineae bacterium]
MGDTPYKAADNPVHGDYITLLDDTFYRIQNYDAINPFFISVVSSSDHWLFISTTGGISAGRVNAESALFPYYTADKISENSDNTGSKSFFLVTRDTRTHLWEPFSDRLHNVYQVERNLYKNISGTTLVFEEINHDLQLTYRYAWRTSDAFGFVKTSWLQNLSSENCTVELVDGLQNLLPANVSSATQTVFSILLDAYKRGELESQTGLGIFSLSSRLTDLAEPSESLTATTVWHTGLENAQHLLSSTQLNAIRSGNGAQQETDIRGQRSAYFVHAALDLAPTEESSWHLVAEVNQDSAAITQLISDLSHKRAALSQQVEQDIALSTQRLETVVASSDGLQLSNDPLSTAHHFANVLFNIMRGGIFAEQYHIDTADLRDFVSAHNRHLLTDQPDFFAALPETILVGELRKRADASGCTDLVRLCSTYLPLTFSRRHGDPSRPWNRFAINVKKADGSRKLDYEGNWRDIFQNWEALAYSYPEFIEGMIGTFLDATTADGYNPYRVTRNGIDWEKPEPNNPWANIGYWSDHQIIYLQKLMEVCAKFYPGKLEDLLARQMFSYANIPYRLKAYPALVNDPYATIDFDWAADQKVTALVNERGSDGKLVLDAEGKVLYVTLAEKLLTLLLAKLVNFVPEGGIWMNTQRPEWNDANNALVGKGLSVVTLCYLRRYITFFADLLKATSVTNISISSEVHSLFTTIDQVLIANHSLLNNPISDEQRRSVMDALGQAGSDYRWGFYNNGFSGEVTPLSVNDLKQFLALAQTYVEHTLRANKRDDGLYHAYNTLKLDGNRATVNHLAEMFEGQVAILSSGLLTSSESLELLQTIRHSALYRADQHSYILYPNRDLPGFLEKNRIEAKVVSGLALVAELVKQNERSLIVKDVNGDYHFSGHIRNAKDVTQALTNLKQQQQFAQLVAVDSEAIMALFERVFHHDAFTGRSGTFFAYEGLGSIYWHMVSKYLLAAQEAVLNAVTEDAPQETIQALADAYFDIRLGLGFNKSPDVYGAFPTDPYSHTPAGQGAKQPGMTGMVKEEIITRLAELGLIIEQGKIGINPLLIRTQELLTASATFEYYDVGWKPQQLDLPPQSLAYTFCQVPIVIQASAEAQIIVKLSDQSQVVIRGNTLDAALSQHIFLRDGMVRQLTVFCDGIGHQSTS